MEAWQDNGIVIKAQKHNDHGAIVTLLTENAGRYLGYVQGGMSSKKRSTIEIGNLVAADWSSRLSENMGAFNLELERNVSSGFIHDPQRLLALQSACAMLNLTLPEREAHPNLYYGTVALFQALDTEVWAESYIIWEIGLLRELGFGIDLTRCAGGGDNDDLCYVSPKSAMAVSREKAQGYEDKLLPLPQFLLGKEDADPDKAIVDGLKLTSYFFEHRVFADSNVQGFPEARQRLISSF
jgi:DNA repair protein RecO (recombination protein O)